MMNKQIDNRIKRHLASIRQPFRGKVKLVNSAPGVSMVQIVGVNGEVLPDLEYAQHYGLTSVPLDGSQVVVVPLGGKSSQGVIIASEHGNYRIKQLKPGEVAIYSHNGDQIVLRDGRTIEITTQTLKINASIKVQMNTPLLQVNAGDIKADDISLKHHRNKDVQPGSGNSGEAIA